VFWRMVAVRLFLCYNATMRMEQIREKMEVCGIPDEVLRDIVTDGRNVDFHTSFAHDDLGSTPRERNVHVLLRNTLDEEGGVRSFTIEFKNQGKLIGVFGVALLKSGELAVVHRRVDSEYQGLGIGTLGFDIAEAVSVLNGRPVEVDVAEPDVRTSDGDFAVNAVQLDTLKLLQGRGFVPADYSTLQILENLQARKGFDFITHSDSGPKAIPQSRQPISVVMRGGVGGGAQSESVLPL